MARKKSQDTAEAIASEFKTLYKTELSHGRDWMKYHEVIEFNNRKFRILIVQRNGATLHDISLYVLIPDGTWGFVVNAYTIYIPSIRDYVCCSDERYCNEVIRDVRKEFFKYIKAVYS